MLHQYSSSESTQDLVTGSSDGRCIALRQGLGTGLVDDDTALQYCSYTRRPCAHESNVLFLSVGVFGSRQLLIFQKGVLLQLKEKAASMVVPVYSSDNRSYKFKVVDKSVPFLLSDQKSSWLAGGRQRALDVRRRQQVGGNVAQGVSC